MTRYLVEIERQVTTAVEVLVEAESKAAAEELALEDGYELSDHEAILDVGKEDTIDGSQGIIAVTEYKPSDGHAARPWSTWDGGSECKLCGQAVYWTGLDARDPRNPTDRTVPGPWVHIPPADTKGA